MGFFDALVSAGKAAGKAVNDKMDQQIYDLWEKVKRASEPRLMDLYNQNNTEQRDNATNRALALAALSYNNSYKAKDLYKKDEAVQSRMKRIRERISLDEGYSSDELRAAIDKFIK